MVSIGRAIPFEGLGLDTIGMTAAGRMPRPDEHLRIAPRVYVVGDPAGPELHTHLAHYQGEMAVRIARGEDVAPDYRAIPRALYTDPEVASVGLLLEQALEAGHDAFEATADLDPTARGYTAEATGHITIVVDRATRTLLGVFIGGPGASELIHEAVLAVKLRIPLVRAGRHHPRLPHRCPRAWAASSCRSTVSSRASPDPTRPDSERSQELCPGAPRKHEAGSAG